MAPTRAIQVISFLLTIILSLRLSLSQRLLVLVGGILGASISYSYFEPLNRTHPAANGDLVSMDDAASNKCISLTTRRCRNTAVGQWQKEYAIRREELGSCRLNQVQMALGELVRMKLCTGCRKKSTVQTCIDNYVKKWSVEVQQKLLTGDIPSISRETEADAPCSEGLTVLSPGSDGTPFPRAAAASHVPGDYPERPASQLLSHTAHRGRRDSTMRPNSSDSDARPVSSPTGLIDGWRLVPYDYKDKPGRTLHDKVFANLDEKELKVGLVYILRREQDETYYQVGYTNRDMKSRLKEHNDPKKCNGNWNVLLSKTVNHAKRVEQLMLLEFALRGLRYQESWCKTGRDNCTSQHNEIIQASFETVEACVQHWVAWMTNYQPYKQKQATLSYPCSTNAEDLPNSWELARSYVNRIYDINDGFCQMSTGESWVRSSPQQRNKPRSKSTSATVTPTRPKLAEQTREVQSEQPADRLRYDLRSYAWQDGRHLAPTQTPSRRASRSSCSGTPDGVEKTTGPRGHSPDPDVDVDGPEAIATKDRATPVSQSGRSGVHLGASLEEVAEQHHIGRTDPLDDSDQDDSAAEVKEVGESDSDLEQKADNDDDDNYGETFHMETGANTCKAAKQINSWNCHHCGVPNRFLQKNCSQCRTPREIVDLTLDDEDMRGEVHNDLDGRRPGQGQGQVVSSPAARGRSAGKQAVPVVTIEPLTDEECNLEV
jgi:hypothetical protein